jgi:hypothetical protein
MNKVALLARTFLLLAATASPAAAQAQIELDHVWIMVTPNAPEREALKRAGFEISPDLNRHDGQGTASITVEFENAFLELMWRDPAETVAPGLERAADKFRQRMLWRSSGWCPFGIGFRRTTSSNDPFPFSTWSVTAPWLPPGSAIEMLTPRDDQSSPSLFISPRALSNTTEQAARAARFHHSIGVRRLTAVHLVSPKTYQPVESLAYLQKLGLLSVEQGSEWLLNLTFDGGSKKNSKDLRPDLPLVVHF